MMKSPISFFIAIFFVSFLPTSSPAALTCRDLFAQSPHLGKLEVTAVEFFVKHLRIPTPQELSKAAQIPLREIKATAPDYAIFWAQALAKYPKKREDAEAFLVRAYYNFVNAQKGNGLTPRSATEDEFFDQILKNSNILREDSENGVFELKHVQRLLGLRERKPDKVPYPILFDGLNGLRLAAKKKYPNSFKDMRDQRFGKEYNQETMNMIVEKYNGGIAISFRGKAPWKEGFFTSLVAIAKARNLVILVKEINGEVDAIPDNIVNHPQVRVITQTIDFGNELRIWGSMVIIPTNKNPLTGLLERMMGRWRGQSQIVFSTQRALSVVATEKNHITGAHQVWSTGSLNEPIYPYSNYASSRVSQMASERDVPGAVIFEKTDRASGPIGRGSPGRWHITNADWSIGKNEYGPGVVDRQIFYPADGSAPRPVSPSATVPGDGHIGFHSEGFVKAMVEEVFEPAARRGKPISVIRLHDLVDGDKISPWDRASDRTYKQLTDGLSFQTEINWARRMINDLLHLYPDLKIVISDQDNHHLWVMRQLDNPAALDDPINGPMLVKLRAVRDSGRNVFEYLFRLQKADDMAIVDPVIRQKTLNANVYIDNPENIRVLKKGESFEVEGFNLASHGDKVDRGRRGGSNMDPHAKANDRAVVGHTHEVAILAYIFNPGMMVRLRSQLYALHGYSAQTQALINIYPNGAAQIEIYDPQVGRLEPDLEIGPLPGKKHFTSEPFVVDDPNNLVEEGATTLNNYDRKSIP